MKVRNGYVSNSSSSSFIIEFNDIEHSVRISGEEISLNHFFEAVDKQSMVSETEMGKTTLSENGREKLLENIDYALKWYDDNHEIKTKLLFLKEDLKDINKNFAMITISYHDYVFNFLFKLLCKYELFKIRYVMED